MSTLALPDWEYDSRGLTKSDILALLQDYYSQMGSNYLPSLDTFAQQNAGQMVDWNPNQFMSIEDFGYGNNRGDLRNQDIIRNSHDLYGWTTGNESRPSYYTRTPDGQYRVAQGNEGEELFTMSQGDQPENGDPTQTYTSAGNYHTETLDEAVARLLGQGGGYATGGFNDFIGTGQMSRLASDQSGKWGSDYVNMPELQQYLDDPNWVAKDENGNITQIRAELYPLLMREALGEESRDINRGGTKESGGFGDLVKMALLGTVTGGLGLAGATAMGLGTAAAGAGLGATMAGMGTAGLATAGAIGGALNAGLTDQDILRGALTGGVLGGIGSFAKDFAPGVANSLGIRSDTGVRAVGGAITGGVGSAVNGRDPLRGILSGGLYPIVSSNVAEIAPFLDERWNKAISNALITEATGGDSTSIFEKAALKSGLSYFGDLLKGDSLPTDKQLQKLQFENPNKYYKYAFGNLNSEKEATTSIYDLLSKYELTK
jgi:hypothetical protein